jgi:small conductance mechanosensitive channel
VHPDKSHVILPNRKVIGEILHNFGTMRQLPLKFAVSYDTNIPQAIDVIRQVVLANPRVIKDPAPAIGISDFGASAINLAVGPWVAVKDYGPSQAELNLAIYEQLTAAKITLPFPQQEIRILNETLPIAANK